MFFLEIIEHHNPEYFNNYADLFGREKFILIRK